MNEHDHASTAPRSPAMTLAKGSSSSAPVQTNDNFESDAAPTSHALFIIPTRWGDDFMASIQGHMLELADPTDHRLAPSPDDLLVGWPGPSHVF
jgi:hypothetical protein